MSILIYLFMAIILSNQTSQLDIKSSAFKSGDYIPEKYSCTGKNINPPLSISNIPKEAKSLALIVEDPDAPKGVFDHWIAWNIPVSQTEIKENSSPGIQGANGSGKSG